MPRRSRKFWLGVGILVVVFGAVVWGAWSLWKPDPLREVHEALDRREFSSANDMLAKRLALHPDDAPTRLLAARAARRSGEPGRAFDHLRKYREMKGPDEAFELESALLRVQSGDAAEADRLFATSVSRPEAPETPFVMEAYLEGRLKVLAPRSDTQPDAATANATAVANLRKATDLWLQLRPGRADQVQGRIWLARLRIFANDHPGGVMALREALALDPDHFDARFQLAMSLSQQRPDETRQHLENLYGRFPEDVYIRFGLATTYRMLGRVTESRRLLEGLLAGPTETSALVELAAIDMDEGKVPQAELRLRKALEWAPNAPETNIAMCRCQQLAGRPDEAAKYRKRFDEIEAARKKPPTPGAPAP